MSRTEFGTNWEGPGDGTVYNPPGFFEYGTIVPIYTFVERDYVAAPAADSEDPYGTPAGTGVVAGEA